MIGNGKVTEPDDVHADQHLRTSAQISLGDANTRNADMVGQSNGHEKNLSGCLAMSIANLRHARG